MQRLTWFGVYVKTEIQHLISTESIDAVTVTFLTEQGINGINETKLF